jgi:hypothetical protein
MISCHRNHLTLDYPLIILVNAYFIKSVNAIVLITFIVIFISIIDCEVIVFMVMIVGADVFSMVIIYCLGILIV